MDVLKPLITGTLGNIERIGIPAALTGPVARGDRKTIADHLEAIETKLPDLLTLYRTLGRHTLTIAEAKGSLSPQAALCAQTDVHCRKNNGGRKRAFRLR